MREKRKEERKGRNDDVRERKRKRSDLWKMKFPFVNEMVTKEEKESQLPLFGPGKGRL